MLTKGVKNIAGDTQKNLAKNYQSVNSKAQIHYSGLDQKDTHALMTEIQFEL